MPRGARKPTLETVARAVGVSRATVSNAYNRPDQLSAELRARILSTARQLGYPGPDPVARSLATRRATSVAVLLGAPLTEALGDAALTTMLDGVASVLDEHDHTLVLLPGYQDGGPRPQRVVRAHADLVLVASLADGVPALHAVAQRRLPLVVLDQPAVPGAARVEIDDEAGAVAAAEHLVALGHRRFGILALPLSPDGVEGPVDPQRTAGARFRVSLDRLVGYLRAIRLGRTGGGTDEVPTWEAPTGDQEAGRRGAHWLLRREPRPTALLCMSDELALGAMRAARDLGLDVPRQVSVVGFDDVPAAARAEVPLTTVHQPLVEKGLRAGELILEVLTGARPRRPVRLPVELVTRASTTPPGA